MPPTPLRLYELWHEIAWKAFVAVPLTIARPVLDRATRRETPDA